MQPLVAREEAAAAAANGGDGIVWWVVDGENEGGRGMEVMKERKTRVLMSDGGK